MKKESSYFNTGFLLIEVILSVALFALTFTGLLGMYLYGIESTALAGNRSRATLLAQEGIEASKNIRDNAFSNLSDGNWGITTAGNQFNLSGSSDTDGFFTRIINIVTVDSKRKDITSTVNWQQNPQRTGSVSVVTRLTNWIAASVTAANHLFIYGDSTITPKFRTYDDTTDSFSAEDVTADVSSGNTFVLRASPTQHEFITGFVDDSGVLNVMCYNGSSWINAWSVNVGGVGAARRFDISYETNSGDAIILYSRGVASTNEMAYRTKSGSNLCGAWSSATNLDPIRTSGIVHWIKLAWDRRGSSNLITAIWAGSNADLSAMVWSGTAWGNEPTAATATNLERIATAQDVESFDVEYESLSGDVMIVWGISVGNNTNGVRYRTCTGGTATCTWGAVTTPPTFNDDATNLDISANPNTDQMIFASIGNNQADLQIGYWSGSVWINDANADTSCNKPVPGSKYVTTGWLINGSTTRSVINYVDSGSATIDWFTGNLGTFTKQSDVSVTPSYSNPNGTLNIEMNPSLKDRLMYTFSDKNNSLFAKRLVMGATGIFTWTDSDSIALTTTLPQTTNRPFSFAFLRN